MAGVDTRPRPRLLRSLHAAKDRLRTPITRSLGMIVDSHVDSVLVAEAFRSRPGASGAGSDTMVSITHFPWRIRTLCVTPVPLWAGRPLHIPRVSPLLSARLLADLRLDLVRHRVVELHIGPFLAELLLGIRLDAMQAQRHDLGQIASKKVKRLNVYTPGSRVAIQASRHWVRPANRSASLASRGTRREGVGDGGDTCRPSSKSFDARTAVARG